MSNIGVQYFYYTRVLPPRSVAIAKIGTPPLAPVDLVDINNFPYLSGDLTIRKSATLDSSPADFIAPDYMQSVLLHSDTQYRLYNQFFEITNIQLDDLTPAYYIHILPDSVDQQVVILDIKGNSVDVVFSRVNNLLYHSMDGSPYRVRYVDSQGYLHTDLLQYTPVLTLAPFNISNTTYGFVGRNLLVASTGNYWLRFTRQNGYHVLKPYSTQPNSPWYPRIGFGLTPVASEWATQIFLPQRPYMLATWVPGIVLDNSLIEFERKNIFYNSAHLPDVLIFNSDYSIKYALEGTLPGTPRRRGSLYNWKRGLIQFIDAYSGRLQVAVDLDPTDIVFGFYSYQEQDVIYRNLDVNPFTNPAVKDKIVEFYFKNNGTDPFHYIYHQVIDAVSGPIAGATNDPSPNSGTNIVFGNLIVGTGIGVQSFTMSDIRVRGGGLTDQFQDIPDAVNFWDLGFWDGKPYPIGGALAIYVPSSVLSKMSRDSVLSKVQSSLPAGTLAVIHYYDSDGTEVV